MNQNISTMKKTNQFKTFLIAALVAVSSGAFAQVKIGSNPTVIETASNLEVEASDAGNHKVKVNKTTGQLTIKDGTEGLDKLLTSDASGGASWSSGTSAFKALQSGGQTITAPPGVINSFVAVNITSTVLDQDGGLDLTLDRYTVSKPGVYLLHGNYIFSQTQNSAGSIALFKNGVLMINAGQAYAAGTANALNISMIDISVAGDYYELRANVNVGSATISQAVLSGTRVR